MGTQHNAAHEITGDGGRGVAGGKINSPRQQQQQQQHHQRRVGSTGVSCGQMHRCSSNVRAVLALGILAGCTTISLQLMASRHTWVNQATSNLTSSESRGGVPWESQQEEASTQHKYPLGGGLGSPVVPKYGRQRLTVDRRFEGQRTGRPPKGVDEVEYRPLPSPGPFGWGTDWAVGVSTRQGEEDTIEPSWCLDEGKNRSFVEDVMERRATVDPSNRVASCVRTKDWGRYLPEWVAYHWALGVDEFVVLDDQSADDTREVLEPFIRAGIVKLRSRRISGSNSTDVVEPLNECVRQYREMQDYGVDSAPRWVVLIDTDEYLWAGDVVDTLTLEGVLEAHSSTCCLQVPRVQHGSSGLSEPPRGLIIENFLMHADPTEEEINGPPKVVVNLRPDESASGKFHRLTSPHTTDDCRCDVAPVEELAVRHYVTTREDLRARTRRYWGEEGYTDQKVDAIFKKRDRNDHSSDAMLVWGCVVRHVLARAASGRHVVTNRSLPSLSPHHPAAHGMRPLDPYGEQELNRTAACTHAVRSCPTTAGTVWGSVDNTPYWLQHLCAARYVFVHSFAGTGGVDVVRLLGAHAWTKAFAGKPVIKGTGVAMSTAVASASEMQVATGVSQIQQCGCTEAESPGCWRLCPALQRSIQDKWRVNKARKQLVQEWSLRFSFKTEPGMPLVVVERDPDMFVTLKQALFPFVSTSVLPVRHPLCTPAVARKKRDGDVAAGLSEWRNVWTQVLAEQLPEVEGDVWVVRYEDILAQEDDVTSALWAAVGLPPISPYPSATRLDAKHAKTTTTTTTTTTTKPEKPRRTATAAVERTKPDSLARTLEDEPSTEMDTPRRLGDYHGGHGDRGGGATLSSPRSSIGNDVDAGNHGSRKGEGRRLRSRPEDITATVRVLAVRASGVHVDGDLAVRESEMTAAGRGEDKEELEEATRASGVDVDGGLAVGGSGVTAAGWGGEEEGVVGEGVRASPRRLIAGDALSRASGDVQGRAIPLDCRTRITACEADSACVLELERASALMEFFGYGGEHDVLNSHRFLWGKEELLWLGKRLEASPSDPLTPPKRRADFDSRDEPSFILPQAYEV